MKKKKRSIHDLYVCVFLFLLFCPVYFCNKNVLNYCFNISLTQMIPLFVTFPQCGCGEKLNFNPELGYKVSGHLLRKSE